MKPFRLLANTILPTLFTRSLKSFTRSKVLRYGSILTTLGLLYQLQTTLNNHVVCIEDVNTIAARKQFDSAVREMRKEYGQLTVYPDIKISTHGNTYVVEF